MKTSPIPSAFFRAFRGPLLLCLCGLLLTGCASMQGAWQSTPWGNVDLDDIDFGALTALVESGGLPDLDVDAIIAKAEETGLDKALDDYLQEQTGMSIEDWVAIVKEQIDQGNIEPTPDPVNSTLMLTDTLHAWPDGPYFCLSREITEAQFDGYLAVAKERGWTTMRPFFFNKGDGRGQDVNVIENKEFAMARLLKIRAAGLRVDPYGYADDSNYGKRSADQLITDLKAAWDLHGALCSTLTPILEPDEWGSREKAKSVIRALASHIGEKPCYVHTLALNKKNKDRLWMVVEGVDGVDGQLFSPWHTGTPAQALSICEWATKEAGVPCHGGEYGFSGEAVGARLKQEGLHACNGF